MPLVERAYRHSTRMLGVLLLVLGLAIVATTIARGGGVLASGVLAGFALAAFGGARAYLSTRAPASDGGR
jgi:hypothetical protein